MFGEQTPRGGVKMEFKRAQSIKILGDVRSIKGLHTEPGRKLILTLDRDETAEMVFYPNIDEEEMLPGIKPLENNFFGWRIPPESLLENEFIIPSDLMGKRLDDPLQTVIAEWPRDAEVTIKGAPTVIWSWCDLLIRPSTHADRAYLFSGQAGGEETAHPTSHPMFELFDAGRRVRYREEYFTFTPNQAAVVNYLWLAWQQKAPDVADAVLLEQTESAAFQRRLRDIFKSNGKIHPAWDSMITSKRKGMRRLNLDKQHSRENPR
jgi:hypothetical protein